MRSILLIAAPGVLLGLLAACPGKFDVADDSGASSGVVSTTSSSSTSSSTTAITETTNVPSTCGNGVLDEPEVCDDGNSIEGDGCNNNCEISGSLEWCKVELGDEGAATSIQSLAVDSHGNVVVVGRAWNQQEGVHEAFVAKYTGEGEKAWDRRFHGDVVGDPIAYGLDIDSLDSIMVSAVLTDGNALIRLSEDGATSWIRHADEPISLVESELVISSAGKIALSVSVGVDPVKGALAGIDQDGEIVWLRSVDAFSERTDSQALASDAEGNWLLAGTILVKTEMPGPDIDAHEYFAGYVQKYTHDGELLWTREIPAEDEEHSLFIADLGVRVSHEIVVLGIEQAPKIGDGTKITLTTLAGDGTLFPSKTVGLPEQSSFGYGLMIAPDDSAIVAGMVVVPPGRALVSRILPSGDVQWSYRNDFVPGKGSAFSAVGQRSDGYIYAAGFQVEQKSQRGIVCCMNQ